MIYKKEQTLFGRLLPNRTGEKISPFGGARGFRSSSGHVAGPRAASKHD